MRNLLCSIIVVALAVLGGLALSGARSVSADAGGNASCMGFEASALSPPGSSNEASGGMPDLVAFAQAQPGHPGDTFKFIASLKEGSHAACDEVLEGGG